MASSDHLEKIGREGFNLIDACNRRRMGQQLQGKANSYNYYGSNTNDNNNKEKASVAAINHREAARMYKGVNVEQRYYKPKQKSRCTSGFFHAFKF